MNEGKIVLQRLKDTLDVLKGNKVVTRIDFQIRDMIEDCIEVIDKQQKEIDKQNKVIDEMAKYMEDRRECGQAEEFCNKKDCYVDEYINGYCPKCLNCIKQYFIRKANGDETTN